MIDGTNRRLILALQRNGRTSNADLARQLGLNVSTVAKRIKTLEDNDIVKIRALPNPNKLGYTANGFIAIKAANGKINDICEILNNNFNVNLVVTAFGRFDILASVYYPSWDRLLNFVSSDLSAKGGIDTIETYLVKEFRKRYYGIAIDNRPPVRIDEIDQRIIERLTENGRCRSQHLAQELGISPPTSLRRLSRLLRERVIEVKAVPNPSKIGYAANAFMFMHVEASKLDSVCASLASYRDVFLVMTLFNGYDLIAGINATSPEGLYEFKNQILSIDGIISDETIVRAEIKKRYYGGFLD